MHRDIVTRPANQRTDSTRQRRENAVSCHKMRHHMRVRDGTMLMAAVLVMMLRAAAMIMVSRFGLRRVRRSRNVKLSRHRCNHAVFDEGECKQSDNHPACDQQNAETTHASISATFLHARKQSRQRIELIRVHVVACRFGDDGSRLSRGRKGTKTANMRHPCCASRAEKVESGTRMARAGKVCARLTER